MTDNPQPTASGQGVTPTDDPDRLRRDIQQTREELGDTVEALSDKADVKGQVSQKIDERKTALRDKVSGARQRASEATPEDAKRAAVNVRHQAESRPLPAIAGALVVGFLLGRTLSKR
jgi:ElaB/YqjD/DUF883 family membrane-anchored ribosome-binding protein